MLRAEHFGWEPTTKCAEMDEGPVHQVTLSSFKIGKIQVTQGLWESIMGGNPSRNKKGADYPVELVSWKDCQKFIEKLNQATGKNFRLPTEAEWEFAARGGNLSKGFRYSGSNNLFEVAWCSGNSHQTTQICGSKAPNELGIYDMTGNVWEWCQDSFGRYTDKPQNNPVHHDPYYNYDFVLRGGSWATPIDACRITDRHHLPAETKDFFYGLRLAMSVDSNE